MKKVRERQVLFVEEWEGTWLNLTAVWRGQEYRTADVVTNRDHLRMLKNILMSEINNPRQYGGPVDITVDGGHGWMDQPDFVETRRPIVEHWPEWLFF